MKAIGIGLLVEEQRGDVAAAWKRAVEVELGGEAALAFAVAPLLREMALALRGETAGRAPAGGAGESTLRSAVLVRSSAAPGRLAREFKLLHRALWTTVRAAGRIVAAEERRAADEWLDEALATALDRLDRVRARADLLERAPAPAGAAPAPGPSGARPPPLPWARRPTPPPLPALASHASE
jgi:hypothetical protein